MSSRFNYRGPRVNLGLKFGEGFRSPSLDLVSRRLTLNSAASLLLPLGRLSRRRRVGGEAEADLDGGGGGSLVPN